MIAGMANFESTVRATNALTATNEYYSAELACVVGEYAKLEEAHKVVVKQLMQARREAMAGSVLAAEAERMSLKEKQSAVLASTLKAKHPTAFDAVSSWDLSSAVARYAVAIKPPADG